MAEDEYVIKVKGLSKVYNLRERYATSFAEAVNHGFKSLGKRSEGLDENQFWALKNINFEVKRGEILGIIGKNGAGKSTLLKVLSEITEPTEGSIEIYGRITSIIEIGTGFHPELTGRENIFLSGSILGMEKQKIKERFDDIVAFSGIGEFVEVPVKRYSSGMFLRLAFSIVSHLDADIILLDEVLSVGDQEFSIKSFAKIKEMMKEGKAVILVSHDLGSISTICSDCIILDKGKVVYRGNPVDVVGTYIESTILGMSEESKQLGTLKEKVGDLEDNVRTKEEALENSTFKEERLVLELEWAKKELEKIEEEEKAMEEEVETKKRHMSHERSWEKPEDAPGNEFVKVKRVTVRALDKSKNEDIQLEDALHVEIEYWKLKDEFANLSVILNYQVKYPVLSVTPFRSHDQNSFKDEKKKGLYQAECVFPAHFFNRGMFTLDLFFVSPDESMQCPVRQVITFKVNYEPKPDALFKYDGNFPGPIFPYVDWKMERKQELD